MKNAENVHFSQVDHKIEKTSEGPGFVVLPSSEAFERFSFVKNYFKQKPNEGYFIWVKKSLGQPLTTCITISSPKVSQNPRNLIVIEKNVEAKIHSICSATKKNLCGSHRGHSKVVVKENANLKIKHLHQWGKKDSVSSSLEFFLEKGAKLSHTYKCLETPLKLKTENNTYLEAYSSANFVVTVLAKDGDVEMIDSTFLNGKESNGISKIRMVGDRRGRVVARSRMVADGAGVGHLDCMGLLLSEDASVQAIPELINKNKDASLTHEASVGKISEENLNYLRSRGLSEDEAIDLIVTGFLGEEKPLVIKGRTISSELYM